MKTPVNLLSLLLVLISGAAFAQQPAPTLSAGQLAPLAASLKAQTAGASPGDITLGGTVTWLIGTAQQTAPVTLTALASGASREVYALGSGTLTEQWDGPDSAAAVTGRGAKGTKTVPAGASIVSPGFAWFAPALLLARAKAAGWEGAERGAGDHDGAKAEHLAIWPAPAAAGGLPAAALRQQRRVDVYLDPATHLPRSAVFWIRPTGVTGKGAPAHVILAPEEVRYSGYAPVAGVMMPLKLEVVLGRRAIMRINLASAQVDTGASLAPLQ